MSEERRVDTVEEVALALRISRSAAYRAVRSGEIPSLRIGRRVLVPRARLQALLGETEGGGRTAETRNNAPG